MIAGRSSVRQNPRVAARSYDGRVVVVVIDKRQVHTLNALGSRIWDMADGRRIDSIVDALLPEYDVARETLLRDTCAYLQQLAELGAVNIKDEAA